MIVRRDETGDLLLQSAPDFVLDALQQAADLCESDDPAIRSSLIQDPYEDEKENEQWRRLVGDDLLHLFESRSEIVRTDLGAAALESSKAEEALDDVTWEVRVPIQHLSAWQETLNGASHALFAKYELTGEDTENALALVASPEKLLAVQQIRIYSILLHVLLEAEGYGDPDDIGGPEDFDSPDFDPSEAESDE